MRLKSKKAELEQIVKVKYVVMRLSLQGSFSQAKPHIFRIPKNKKNPNTPSRCLNFFFVQGLSNLNCFQGSVGKIW